MVNNPNIRFAGFADDWEERKLGDVLRERNNQQSQSLEYPLVSFTVEKGVTPKTDRYDREQLVVGDKSSKKYKVTVLNDIVYNPANLKFGAISRNKYGNAVFSPIYITFVVNNDVTTPEFIEMFVTRNDFIKRALKYQQGTVYERQAVSPADLLSMVLYLPEKAEQQKIGSVFSTLDHKIGLEERQLSLLKDLKKGYLEKMFPKNGATVPELRFAGFADDWEERKLGEFSDVRDGTHASPKYVSQGHPMVTSKNLTHSGLDMTDVSFLTDKDFNEINKRSKVSIGDILFGMIGTIGNPVIVDRDDFAIKNVALIKEKTSNPITNKWLLQYLKSPSFNRFIQKENAGGTQKFIALGLIRDMKLRVPEFDEQQKIGQFFKQLDDTITLHQRKLDLLKDLKKGLSQQMFV